MPRGRTNSEDRFAGLNAVRAALAEPRAVADVAAELGLPVGTIHGRIKALQAEGFVIAQVGVQRRGRRGAVTPMLMLTKEPTP